MSTRRLHLVTSVSNTFTPGWQRGEGANVISAPPKVGCEVIWVVWESDSKFLYDQVLRAERPGVVFLPVSDGKIGLQQAFRPQSRDQKKLTRDFPNIDLGDLGKVSWEVPRGFGKMNESSTETLEREVKEETGGRVLQFRWLPQICDNTAFSPHLTKLAVGQVDLTVGTPENSPFEPILAKLTWFGRAEILQMCKGGDLYCGYTLAAIGSLLLEDPAAIV